MHNEDLDKLVRNSAGLKYSSFNDLYQQLCPKITNHFRKFLWYNPEYAKEVASETFLRVIDKIEQFQPGTNITAWIYQIARNIASDFRDKKKKINYFEVPFDRYSQFRQGDQIPDSVHSENDIIGNLYIDSVFKNLQEKVKPLFLETIEMLYLGFGYEEISEQLSIPMGTAQSRINRGKCQSRLCIEEFIDIDEKHL